jgi:hypothetical protein
LASLNGDGGEISLRVVGRPQRPAVQLRPSQPVKVVTRTASPDESRSLSARPRASAGSAGWAAMAHAPA